MSLDWIRKLSNEDIARSKEAEQKVNVSQAVTGVAKSLYDVEQVQREPVAAQLITYPITGVRETSVTEGVWRFNLKAGYVTKPDGSSSRMSTSLNYIRDQVCRSCFILVSDADVKVRIAGRILPNDHTLVHVLQGMEFDSIDLEFPTGRTPTNDFQFTVAASNSPILPFQVEQTLTHHRSTETGTTTNSYVTIYDTHIGGYDQAMVTVENTAGSNSLTARLEYSEDGTDYYKDPDWNAGADLAIAASSYDTYASSIKHHFIRVQVKSTSTDAHTTFKVIQNIMR